MEILIFLCFFLFFFSFSSFSRNLIPDYGDILSNHLFSKIFRKTFLFFILFYSSPPLLSHFLVIFFVFKRFLFPKQKQCQKVRTVILQQSFEVPNKFWKILLKFPKIPGLVTMDFVYNNFHFPATLWFFKT